MTGLQAIVSPIRTPITEYLQSVRTHDMMLAIR